jgi:hypothetical protein
MMKSFFYVALVMAFVPFANGDTVGQVICSMAPTQELCNITSQSLDGGCVFQSDKCVFDPAITCPQEMYAMLDAAIKGLEQNCTANLVNASLPCSAECRAAALNLEVAGFKLEGLNEAQAVQKLSLPNITDDSDPPTKEYIACIGQMLGDVPADITSQSVAVWPAFNRFQQYGRVSCGPFTAEEAKAAFDKSTKPIEQSTTPNDASRISFSVVAVAITIFSVLLF